MPDYGEPDPQAPVQTFQSVNLTGRFGGLIYENAAQSSADKALNDGRLLRLRWLFDDRVTASTIEAIAMQIAYRPVKTSTTLLECIDATAVSQGLHNGSIQTMNAAISKSSTGTTALAAAFAAWPAYAITAGTVTTLYGLYVYGNQSSTGGTVGTQVGVGIAEITTAATIGAGLSITHPSGPTTKIGILLAKNSANQQSNIWFQDNGTGYVIMQAQNSTTTWTFQLPPDDGDAGEQLQTNGSGVTTWEAAASTREVKVLHATMSGDEALQRIRSAPVYRFHYDPNAKHVGGDYDTEFVGIVADEAPWAMKHNGRIFNPINAFGHAAAAIQALAAKVEALEAKIEA